MLTIDDLKILTASISSLALGLAIAGTYNCFRNLPCKMFLWAAAALLVFSMATTFYFKLLG